MTRFIHRSEFRTAELCPRALLTGTITNIDTQNLATRMRELTPQHGVRWTLLVRAKRLLLGVLRLIRVVKDCINSKIPPLKPIFDLRCDR